MTEPVRKRCVVGGRLFPSLRPLRKGRGGIVASSLANGGSGETSTAFLLHIGTVNSAEERTPHPSPLPFGRGEGESSPALCQMEVQGGGSTAFLPQ